MSYWVCMEGNMWFDRQVVKWDMLPQEELIRKLTLPEGRLDMVLDTDTYNEVDDQFAMAYALMSPERLNVQAIYAAPFHNGRSTGAGDGMRKSYAEIVRLLGKMGRSAEGFVFEGSESFLTGPTTPVDSPAARDLIARAMARSSDNPLYVVAIGAITNVASAILLEPEIRSRIVVVWLGGHPTSYPSCKEFNLSQDILAARTVLDCGVPVHLVPCLGVASHLLATVPELREYLGGRNDLCDALIELFAAYETNHVGWAKEIWDLAPVAYLVNSNWVPSKLTHSPIITDESRWAHDENRHLIREAYFCHRTPVFRDLFSKL